MSYMLCQTCRNETMCTYKSGRNWVMSCDEFTGARNSVSHRPVQDGKAQSERSHSPLDGGLCANCSHREGCTYPHSSRTVVQCEEYA